MRLLIAPDEPRFLNLKQFGDALTHYGIEYEIIDELEISDKYKVGGKYLRRIQTPKEYKEKINKFKPDVVFTVRASSLFSSFVVKSEIPLLIYLLGDFWNEKKWFKQTTHMSLLRRLELVKKSKDTENVFKKSKMILPICKYLENITKERYPYKETHVLYQGINISDWHNEKKLELQHPCVGILQGANVWGKTKEMLILQKILSNFPNVTFYWAGDGPFRDEILSKLKKFKNFKWLGSLQYPEKVREYLAGIDVYLLISGLDMSPHTLLEAASMKKPVVATNVGGVSESMVDKKTGFLYKKGKTEDLIEKISMLVNDNKLARRMGEYGKNFVKENFEWKILAKDFAPILKNMNL